MMRRHTHTQTHTSVHACKWNKFEFVIWVNRHESAHTVWIDSINWVCRKEIERKRAKIEVRREILGKMRCKRGHNWVKQTDNTKKCAPKKWCVINRIHFVFILSVSRVFWKKIHFFLCFCFVSFEASYLLLLLCGEPNHRPIRRKKNKLSIPCMCVCSSSSSSTNLFFRTVRVVCTCFVLFCSDLFMVLHVLCRCVLIYGLFIKLLFLYINIWADGEMMCNCVVRMYNVHACVMISMLLLSTAHNSAVVKCEALYRRPLHALLTT